MHFFTVLLTLLISIWTPVAQESRSVRMIPVEGEGARYWSRWRGPSGQGLVAGAEYPDKWSASENVLWKTPVPGRGHSSPIVWADKIFLTTASADGKRLSVLAYRRSDGTRLWEAIAPSGASEAVYPKNSHASATPATDGNLVYVSLGSRGAMAFDMNGKFVWRQDFGPIANYHGTAGSPLLYKDKLILYHDQSSNSFITALDTRSGRRLWQTRRNASVGWGTPVAINNGGRDEIVVNGQGSVVGYSPEDGRELWWCSGTTYEVIPTPVVGNGLIFASSGRAGPTLAIRPGGQGDITRSHIAWSSPRGSPFVPSPVLYENQLYIVNDMSSIVTSFDASSGRTLFQSRLGTEKREGFSASPVAVDGKIFFTNDDGETFVLRAGPQMQLLHVNRIGETTLASPALVDGKWYIRTAGHLMAIGRP
jgi:outer membrane protein assembly factor BamB